MAFQLKFSIEGEQQLSRQLLIMAEKVKDWTPAFQKTANTLKAVFQDEVFETQGGAIDEHWSPLKKAYAEQKAKKHPGKGLLEASGDMRKSFKTEWNSDYAAVWNTADYFKYHQSNKPRSSNLPRRVMMKLANQQKQAIVRIFNTQFQKVLKSK